MVLCLSLLLCVVVVFQLLLYCYCTAVFPSLSALNVAFSSLYRDEFPLDEVQMCSIVAASSMLQLVSRA